MSKRILITGASGRAAELIRPILAEQGCQVVLLDIRPLDHPAGTSETFIVGDLADIDTLEKAMTGVDLIVHLGGYSVENEWSKILAVNIDGTQKILDTAHRLGINRVLLASSTHAIGFWPTTTDFTTAQPRPDTYYGVSKVALEALGSVFADRYDMLIVSARIGTILAKPTSPRHLRTWLSPQDFVRLIMATAETSARGNHVVYAISANDLRWFPLEPGFAIGYRPQDNASEWTDEIKDDGAENPDADVVGASFADSDHKLGEVW